MEITLSILICTPSLPQLNHLKMFQCFLYRFHFLCRQLFQFFYLIKYIIHRQAQTSLYLCYISSMYLEAIFRFYVFLYHFVGHTLFGLIHFCSFSNIIKRNFTFSLARKDDILEKVPKIKDFYIVRLCSNTQVSTVFSKFGKNVFASFP